MRTRTLLLLAVTLTVAPLGVVGVAGVAGVAAGGAAPPDAAVRRLASPRASIMPASQVLSAWDRRRATAWSRADPAALAVLYTGRSRAGARDVAELRRWRSRGLRVVGLRQQVAELHARVDTVRHVVVTVTDRTVGGVAVGQHRRTALPDSGWATHRIRFRRVDGRWRVDEVMAQPAR